MSTDVLIIFCGVFTLVKSSNVELMFTQDSSLATDRLITDKRLYAQGSVKTVSHCAVECRHQSACLMFGYADAIQSCQLYWDEITEDTASTKLSVDIFYYRAHCSDLNGYLYYRGISKCLHRFTKRQNFTGALMTCSLEGATLFEPKTQNLMNFFYKDYAKRFWIGGFVDQLGPTWRWLSGDEISNTSSLWLPGQPVSFDRCLEGGIHGKTYGLNDKNCTFEREFYCETLDWDQ